MRITGPGTWGPPRDRAAARALLRRAVDLGVQLIDTADAYGPGVSEELIAEALFPYDGLLIATKGGYERTGPSGESATGELIGWTPNGRPDHLRSACEASLRRLRLDRIDLYQLHTPDPSVPYTESIGALNALRSEGRIRHIGVSNVTPEQLAVARTITDIATVQNRLDLASSRWRNMLTECESHEIGFIPYRPLPPGATWDNSRSLRQPPPATAQTPTRSPSPGCSQSLPSHCPSPAPQHSRTSKTRRSPLAATKNSSRTCMAGAPMGRTGTRRGLPGMSLGPATRPQISLRSTEVSPSGKARCLLEPVLLYWLHERDA
jgi:diketogulonate reductase-like aldo/keto reductase